MYGSRLFINEDIKETNDLLKRTIEKVLVANDWCYEGCPKCNRKCEEKLSPFICPGCQEENSSTVLRFRLGVKVSHQNDSLKFVLWNKESTLNQIVTDIKNQLIQEDVSITQAEKSVSSKHDFDDTHMSQTVFGSGDYDPEMLESFTPAKRLSSESKFHDVSMEDLAYVMLSSSRLSRQIKIE
ncbi:hypothetical protein JHK82_055482 [Glycine max]|nr:hypothetical protein JHK86_055313 [Glycine max]KAG5076787.1 hypothetical protein JHK82_055482 [Glycine max]